MPCAVTAATKPPLPGPWGSACAPFTINWKRAAKAIRPLPRAANPSPQPRRPESLFGFGFNLHHHVLKQEFHHVAIAEFRRAMQRIEHLLAVAAVANHVV